MDLIVKYMFEYPSPIPSGISLHFLSSYEERSSEYPEGKWRSPLLFGFRIVENVPFCSLVEVTYSPAGTTLSTIEFIFRFDWHFVSDSKASLEGFSVIYSFVEVAYSRAGTI
jgi:hypothetical protein